MTTSLKNLRQLFLMIGKSEWRYLYASSGAAVATVLSSTGLMAFSSYIISFAALRPDVADILVSVTAVRFFGIARAVLRYTERMTSHNTVFRLLSRLRVHIYRGVSAMSGKAWLTMDRDHAFNTLTADIEHLQDFYLRTFMPASISLMVGLLATVIITIRHPLQAFIFATLYTFAHLGSAWLIQLKTKGYSASLVDETAHYRTLFSDYAEAQVEIQTAGRLQDYQQMLTDTVNRLDNQNLKIALWRCVYGQFQQLIVNITVLIALITGALWVQQGRMSGVFLAGVALCCFTLYESAPGVLTIFQKLESSGRSAERILHLMPVGSEPDSPPVTPTDFSVEKARSLTLEQVSWRYTDHRLALNKIHLTLRQGQRIAVVGASGSGKSTLMNLLTGLIPLEDGQGQIKLNDRVLLSHEYGLLAEQFSVVDQNVYLFNMSLRQNLLLGNPFADDGLLLDVLKRSGYPCSQEELSQNVGLSGNQFSGGQRQRIAIARALLRQAPFLLIDEAMAGLDEAKEQEILSMLLEQEQHRGMLWITHRLLFMEQMDHIYVLHQGELIEEGTHTSLMALNGHYAHMMALQNDIC